MGRVLLGAGAWNPASSSPQVPFNLVVPTITGVAQVDQALSGTDGVWTGSPTGYSYQWQRSDTGAGGWTDIAGATSASYTVLAGDATRHIRRGVRAANGVGPGAWAYSVSAGPVSAAAALPTFVLENFSGSSSVGFARVGLPFAKGDVPAGSRVTITRSGSPIDAQFDERTTWSDGSLKFAVCHIRDTAFAGNESRTYQLGIESGAFVNSGSKTLTDATGAVDARVEFSSLAQWNGSTSATRGAGAALAAFATHAAVATRATKIHSGPVCEGWMVWGMARDGAAGGGSEDAHLKTVWYVDLWKNADGSIADVEYAAVVAQDWWSVANKFRLDYTATLKDGATTIATYSGVQHPYRSQWATVRTAADNNHARRHWKTAIPTLVYKPSKSYWVASGLVPPYDTTFTPNSAAAIGYGANYTPCGNMNHRAAIDDVGAYMGRGMLPNVDVVAFMRQTAADYRAARTNAFAGLHIPYHYRANTTRTRPSETADVANTVLPFRFLQGASELPGRTAEGMPASDHWYITSGFNALTASSAYVAPTGGNGVWGLSYPQDDSHAPNYCYFMYLHEGERYLMEATLDLAQASTHASYSNEYGRYLFIPWYNIASQRTALSIPNTRYSAVFYEQQLRGVGFAFALLGCSEAIVPDNDVQAGYIADRVSQHRTFLAQHIQYMPTVAANSGIAAAVDKPVQSPWMVALMTMGGYWAYGMTEATEFRDHAHITARMSIGLIDPSNIGAADAYRLCLVTNGAGQPDPSTKTWFAHTNAHQFVSGTVSANTLTAATDGFPFTNGDPVYFISRDAENGVASLPSGYTEGTLLYAVNSSGTTCQLATTPGGSPVALGSGSFNVALRLASWNDYATSAASPNPSGADDYLTMARAALVEAVRNEHPLGVSASITNADAYLAGLNTSSWVTWKYAN